MHRRRYLTGFGWVLGFVSLSGWTGILPTDSEDAPAYPGGTIVVENTADSTERVRVSVVDGNDPAPFDAAIPAGGAVAECELATASDGEAVTPTAVIGNEGEPATVEFLPARGRYPSAEGANRTGGIAVEERDLDGITWH